MTEWKGKGIWEGWSMTTDHSSSSHDQPVLVDPNGLAYGPGDIKPGNLISQTEFAEIIGWDRRKVATYYWRGKLPEPVSKPASGPVWTRQQAEEYKRLHDAS